MTSQEAYEVIESERRYQRDKWPGGEGRQAPAMGAILLLEDYLRQFREHYQREEDAPGLEVPIACLHDLRKMAAILVRAIEQRPVPPRA